MRVLVLTAAALSGSLLFTRLCAAQGADVESAEGLFKGAKAAMERGDLAAACPEFAESQRLDPAAGTLLNLGECEARQGKLATALAHFQQARAALAAGDYRIGFADEKIAGLTPRIPRLAIKLVGDLPLGAVVRRDDVDVPAAGVGLAVPVDPGVHVVTLRASGRDIARTEVRVDEGRSETAELATTSAPAAAAPSPASGASTQRTAAFTLLGTGAAGLVVGTITGLIAKGTYDSASSLANCPTGPTSCNNQGVQGGSTAHTEASVSTAAFIAGGVLAASGGLLYFTAPKEGRLSVAANVQPGSAGVTIRGAW